MLERLSHRPLILLTVLVAVQVLPTLGSRNFWAYDEVRHADVLRGVLDDGHSISLHLNGKPYPDKPPLYFWYVTPFARLLGTDGPSAFFLASGLAGLLCLGATYALARITIATRPSTALLAPLLLLVTPLFQVLLRTTRMDLLFSALIVLSEVLLIRGSRREGPNGSIFFALVLGGLATLIKGPLGVLLPLLSFVTVLVWQGRFRRLFARDVGFGLLAVAGLIGAWMAGIAAAESPSYLRQLLTDQVFHRALAAQHHRGPFWLYAAVLPVLAAPWPLLLGGAAWRQPFGRERWRRIWDGRREHDGHAWLISIALTGFVLLSAASSKFVIYLMPLFPALAVLGADYVMRLPERRLRRAWIALGAVGLVLAIVVPFANTWALVPIRVGGLIPAALVLGLISLGLLFGRRVRREWLVLWLIGGLGALALTVALVVVPSLDPIFDPGPQARKLAAYADEGYAPLVYKVYPGTYAYHAGRAVPETRDAAELAAHLQRHARVVIATSEKERLLHPESFAGLEEIQRQWIEARPFVLLATPGQRPESPPVEPDDAR